MLRKSILLVCGLMVVAGCAYAAEPVGRWLLNDGQGTTAVNDMGLAYTGSLQGNVTWVEDAPEMKGLRYCVDFGGTANDYIALDNAGTFAPSAVTVACWAKATAIHNGQVFVSKYWSAPGSFELGCGNNGNIYFRVWNTDGTGFLPGQLAENPYTTTMFADDNWHFFAGTADAVEGAKLYVDGVLIETLSMNGLGIRITGNPLLVGRRSYPGAEAPFSGKISCVSIYDTALTEAEIIELMNTVYGNLTGKVILSGYNAAGDESKRMALSVIVEFIQDGSVVKRVKADMDNEGNFVTRAANIPNGTYDIAFVAPQFERNVVTGVLIDGPTTLDPVTLKNGDVDGDNEVTSTDLSVVIQGMD